MERYAHRMRRRRTELEVRQYLGSQFPGFEVGDPLPAPYGLWEWMLTREWPDGHVDAVWCHLEETPRLGDLTRTVTRMHRDLGDVRDSEHQQADEQHAR